MTNDNIVLLKDFAQHYRH